MNDKTTDCSQLKRDILEWDIPEEVLAVILKDRTTGRNLIWATDDYAVRGKGFGANGSAIRQLPTAEIDSNRIRHLPSDEIRPSVMSEFYQDAVIAFQNVQTLCKQSSWSHYRLPAAVDNRDASDFYLSEAVKCNARFPPMMRPRRFAPCRRQRLIRRPHLARPQKEASDGISSNNGGHWEAI